MQTFGAKIPRCAALVRDDILVDWMRRLECVQGRKVKGVETFPYGNSVPRQKRRSRARQESKLQAVRVMMGVQTVSVFWYVQQATRWMGSWHR